eukprot:COSAG01_NODE_3334_length_6237_cov_11.105246_1_plen_1421_part_00
MEELKPGARGTGHGAQDLSALSACALVKQAEEMGIDEGAIDAADGVAALSARALVRCAEEAGADDAQIEAADEAADRRGALTALILERHAEQTRAEEVKLSRLRAELAGLSARALARRAEDMGVGEAQLDAADDAADRKAALMELIMGRVQQQQPAARGGGPSDPTAAAPRPCALSEAAQPEPELLLPTPEGAALLVEGVPPASSEYDRVIHVTKQRDARAQKIVAKPLAQREYDFFINHCQSSGQDQCGKLALLMRARGWRVWYDMSAEDLTEQGMEQGVASSRNVLLFLSDGLMSRPFCIKEQRWGITYGCKFIGVAEFDDRHGGGKSAEGVDLFTRERAAAPEDLQFLFDQVEFEPFQRREHLVESMVTQLGKRGGCATTDVITAAAPSDATLSPVTHPQLETQMQPEPVGEEDSELAMLCSESSVAPGKVLERKSDYSDRLQLRQDISAWALNAASREPGCLVLGEPGAGKTALLMEMVDGASDFQAAVLATHFCVAHEAESLQPMAFVSGVVMQMYKRCRAYREHVEATESVRGKVKKLLTGEGEAMGSFVDLVLGPLKKACPGRERPADGGFVLCIDSLDEALLVSEAARGQAGSIVQLLKTCSSKRLFPPWLRVLATSRDVPEVAQLKSWRRVDLGSATRLEENKQAIRAYINIRLDAVGSPLKAHVDEMAEAEPQPEASGAECEGAAQPVTFHCHAAAHPYFKALVERSGGNFLYAATTLDDVEAGMGDLVDVGSLPTRLDELFLHFFERLFEGAGGDRYMRVRPVFEAIAASEGGVTEAELLKCMRVCEPTAEERVLKVALQGVRQFLKGATQSSSKQQLLVCYHLSFAEWLEAEDNDYVITVESGHRTLAIVQLATLARDLTPALADEVARACVEELECDGGLTGKLIRKMRPKGAAVALSGETVYSLARHLALAIDHTCAASDVLARLLQRGLGDVNVRAAAKEESLEAVSLKEFLQSKLPIATAAQVYDFAMKHTRIRTAVEMRAITKNELLAMYQRAGFAVLPNGFVEAKLAQLRPALGKSALGLAVYVSDELVIRFLLKAGASPSMADEAGQTALHWAAKRGVAGCMHALLQHSSPADVHAKDKSEMTALNVAATFGHVEALRYLLSEEVGAELEAKGSSGMTALHLAVMNGHVEAVCYLLSVEVGAEVEAKTQSGSTALHYAALSQSRSQVQALQCLLSAGVGAELEAKDNKGQTALHLAAKNGYVDALRYLLSAEVGAELEAKTQNGKTALHLAAKYGRVDALRYLLSAQVGAELEAKDQNLFTALHLAANEGHVEVLSYLLSTAGAEVEAKDQDGRTALHFAAEEGHVEVLRYLLSAVVGAEVEAKDNSGDTALHYATRMGQIEAMGALAELGAPVDPDIDGGARLLRLAGGLCKGDDATERRAATAVTLRQLGAGDGGAEPE